MPIVHTTYFVPQPERPPKKCKHVVSATGADGRPVVLKDGVPVSPRDWEHILRNEDIKRLLDQGKIRVERTVQEIVDEEMRKKPQTASDETAGTELFVPDDTMALTVSGDTLQHILDLADDDVRPTGATGVTDGD